MGRRKFNGEKKYGAKGRAGLAILLSLCLVVGLVGVTAYAAEITANDETNNIVIIYTGDMHGKPDTNITLAGLKAYANERQAKSKYVEIVDAGDSLSGSAIASSSDGKYMMDAMNEVGYGIAVPSTDDFSFGVDLLTSTIDNSSSYEYLSCNFVNASTGKTVFNAYKTVVYGNTKVAYIGISDPLTASITKATIDSSKYKFIGKDSASELYTAVQNAADAAKAAGADYVIAIGHLSETGSDPLSAKSIIANTTGITAFIAGGDHVAISGDQVKNKSGQSVLLTSAGANISNIGAITLSPGKSVSSQLISNYSYRYIKTNDAITALTQKYSKELTNVFATSAVDLTSADSDGVRTVGKSETNLGDLVADAYKKASGADIAFVEASEIQGKISHGDVSYSDILNVLPGGNNLSVYTVSGGEILDALEMAARLFPSNNEGFLQVAGMTFDIQETVKSTVTVDASSKFTGVKGEYRVTNVMIGGKELDLMDDYTVVASDAFWAGDTGYAMFEEATLKSKDVATDIGALYDYIASDLNGKITDKYAKQAGRIDYIKLARQSEIDAEIEAGVQQKLSDYTDELEELKEEVATQDQIIAVRTATVKAATTVLKSGSKRKIKITWTNSKKIDGMKYQIYKSTSKYTGYSKIYTASGLKLTNTSSIKKGKTYYYKVRGYKYIDGKYYYTDWSNVTYKTVK